MLGGLRGLFCRQIGLVLQTRRQYQNIVRHGAARVREALEDTLPLKQLAECFPHWPERSRRHKREGRKEEKYISCLITGAPQKQAHVFALSHRRRHLLRNPTLNLPPFPQRWRNTASFFFSSPFSRPVSSGEDTGHCRWRGLSQDSPTHTNTGTSFPVTGVKLWSLSQVWPAVLLNLNCKARLWDLLVSAIRT